MIINVYCKRCQQEWEHDVPQIGSWEDFDANGWALLDHEKFAHPIPCEPVPVFVEYSRTE